MKAAPVAEKLEGCQMKTAPSPSTAPANSIIYI